MSRAIVRKQGPTVRWDAKPLRRSGRDLERFLLLVPWLAPGLWPAVARAQPGSLLRRCLGYLVRAGIEANNRGDYEAITRFMSPAIELHIFPDVVEQRADLEGVYHGPSGYVKASDTWKAGFEKSFRWEVNGWVDSGGDKIAARVEGVGVGSSGVETRWSVFHVFQLDHGLLRRQWAMSTEEAAVAVLMGTQNYPG
jgi:hypothetical protein